MTRKTGAQYCGAVGRYASPVPADSEVPTRSPDQRSEARDRIIHAARIALATKGLDTTVDDVAAAADVSRRTIFRQFGTRDHLLATAFREGLRSYGEHVTFDKDKIDPDTWLRELLVASHRSNAKSGRIYWELSALEPELDGELAEAAAERRRSRRRFVRKVTNTLWRLADADGKPPTWLTDTIAIHLSGFTTQALAGDFDRTPDQVAEVSARVIQATLQSALSNPSAATR